MVGMGVRRSKIGLISLPPWRYSYICSYSSCSLQHFYNCSISFVDPSNSPCRESLTAWSTSSEVAALREGWELSEGYEVKLYGPSFYLYRYCSYEAKL